MKISFSARNVSATGLCLIGVTVPILVIALLFVSFSNPCAGLAKSYPDDSFTRWLADFRSEALDRGFSPEVLDVAFRDVERLQRVIELDRRQPEQLVKHFRNISIEG